MSQPTAADLGTYDTTTRTEYSSRSYYLVLAGSSRRGSLNRVALRIYLAPVRHRLQVTATTATVSICVLGESNALLHFFGLPKGTGKELPRSAARGRRQLGVILRICYYCLSPHRPARKHLDARRISDRAIPSSIASERHRQHMLVSHTAGWTWTLPRHLLPACQSPGLVASFLGRGGYPPAYFGVSCTHV